MSRKNVDIGQLNIFKIIEEVSRKQADASTSPSTHGKASTDAAVRSIITSSLKKSPLSRYQAAARMSEILGVEITKAQLDAWSAESKDNHRFPIVYAAAFCEATGDKTLIRYIAGLCGGYFIEGEEALHLRLGSIKEQQAKLKDEEDVIWKLLNGGKGGR